MRKSILSIGSAICLGATLLRPSVAPVYAWRAEALEYSRECAGHECYAGGLALFDADRNGRVDQVLLSTGEYDRYGELHSFSGDGRHRFTNGSPLSVSFEVKQDDFNNDGYNEIVTVEHSNCVHIIDRNGLTLWEGPQVDGGLFSFDTGDLDGDGKPEIAIGTRVGNILAVKPFTKNSVMWKFELPGGSSPIREVHVADLDNNRVPSVVGLCANGYVIALNHDGGVRWSYPAIGSPGQGFYAGAIGDIDYDGDKEVIAARRDEALLCLERDGAKTWEQPTFHHVMDITIADLDGDERQDEIVVAADGHIAAYSSSGNRLWDCPTEGQNFSIAVGNVNGDETNEVVAGGSEGALHVLNNAGQELWNYPTHLPIGDSGYGSRPAIVVADINADGRKDIVFATASGRICALTDGRPAPENGLVLEGVTLDPTEEAMGVTVRYSGDDDRNGNCYVEFHDGDGRWQRSMDLVRNPSNPLEFIGSVLFLEKGQTYHVRAVAVDAGGVSGNPLASATTENRQWPEDAGKQYWVGVENCSDSGPGSEAQPWCTLQYAESRVQAGSTVNIKPGVYYQQVNCSKSGQPGRPITFRGAGAGVYIDGSNPALLHSSRWVERSDLGARIYAHPLSIRPMFVGVGDPREDGDYGRLFNADDTPDIKWEECWNRFINGWCFPDDYLVRSCLHYGWIYDAANQTLFVRLPEGIDPDPTHHTMHINTYPDDGVWAAVKDYGFHWLNFRNLNFRYAENGIHIKSGNFVHVADCSFAYGRRGVIGRAGASHNTVERCTFFDNNLYGGPWGVGKVGIHETFAAGFRGDGGATANIIRDNVVDGACNGVGSTSRNSDTYNNTIVHILDDAIEIDAEYGRVENERVWSNKVAHVFAGISVSPFFDLSYVIGNTFLDFAPYSIKALGVGGSRGVQAFNNTCYTEQSPRYMRGRVLGASGAFEGFDFRNNIMRCRLRTVESETASPTGGNWFDYNLHWTVDPVQLWFWQGYGEVHGIREVRGRLGYEAHGIEADPLLASYGQDEADLRSTSPAIDAGQVIPGLHCAQSDDVDPGQKCCRHWRGKAPDIGSWESGAKAERP
jgi:hypothetical protein